MVHYWSHNYLENVLVFRLFNVEEHPSLHLQTWMEQNTRYFKLTVHRPLGERSGVYDDNKLKLPDVRQIEFDEGIIWCNWPNASSVICVR